MRIAAGAALPIHCSTPTRTPGSGFAWPRYHSRQNLRVWKSPATQSIDSLMADNFHSESNNGNEVPRHSFFKGNSQPSCSPEPPQRFRAENYAWAQHRGGEARVVGAVREVLGLQAQAGAPGMWGAAEEVARV